MLFGNWLEEQLKYQRDGYGVDLPGMPEADRLRYIDDMLRAAILEVAESYQEFAWKSWSTSQFRNQDALNSELVDVLFFIANALAANGCTREVLEKKYRDKMQINARRQDVGYDGITDKCPKCRRALDDTAVTCTSEKCSEEIPV